MLGRNSEDILSWVTVKCEKNLYIKTFSLIITLHGDSQSGVYIFSLEIN